MVENAEEIKLWSPVTIGVTAFFLGFPGGALLASINAERMGDAENKRKYIMNGVLYIVAFVFFREIIQNSGLTAVLGIANIFLAYWLYHDMTDEIAKNTAGKTVVEIPWWKGALIALAVLISITLLQIVFSTVLA
jgi:hypothetical protein